MTHSSTDDPITRIHNYASDPTLLDLDGIVRSGRRRRRLWQAAAGGGLAVMVAAVTGVVLVVGTAGHGGTRLVVDPASAPDRTRGLLAHHAVAGPVETLSTTPSGWRADVYVDSAGDICEGWVNPANSVMQGACGDALQSSGPTVSSATALTTPLLIEPEAAVSHRLVEAFGLTAPNSSTVTVTDRGRELRLVVSGAHTADGRRAFLVRYRMPRIADWVDTATSRDAGGEVTGTMMFVAPDTGTPAYPLPAPTP
jgi:hypothetical protein